MINKEVAFLIGSLAGGGADAVCINIANELASRGWAITILVMHLNNAAYIDRVHPDVEIHSLDVSNARFAFFPLIMEVILPLAEMADFADFHVVGGTEKDRQHWEEQAQNISNLTFHGHVPHSETHSYIKAFDIVLLPNQEKVSTHGSTTHDIGQWTSPLKAFEYMAAGKPIIASDLRVLREVFSGDFTSLLARPDIVHDWVDALIKLTNEPDFKSRLGHNSQQQFLEKFTWRVRAKKIVDQIQW